MALMTGEKIILQSDRKEFTLTTHRVRIEHHAWGAAYQATIMLEDIVSCELRFRSYPILLALVAVALLIFGLANDSNIRICSAAISAVFVLVYFWSRHQVLALSSAAAVIYVHTRGMSFDNIGQIIDAILKAKNARWLQVP